MAALKRNSIFAFAAVITGLISIIFGLDVVRASLIFQRITALPGRLRGHRVPDTQSVSRCAGFGHSSADRSAENARCC
jgi:hypothetical protein